jgi:hypothetical protein
MGGAIEYGITIPRGDIAERPVEDAHAHDMVGTHAVCLDKVRRLTTAGGPGTLSRPPRTGLSEANASLSG